MPDWKLPHGFVLPYRNFYIWHRAAQFKLRHTVHGSVLPDYKNFDMALANGSLAVLAIAMASTCGTQNGASL